MFKKYADIRSSQMFEKYADIRRSQMFEKYADIRRSQMFEKYADIRRSQMLEKGKQRNMLMSQNISMKSGKNKVDTPARTWSRSIHAF